MKHLDFKVIIVASIIYLVISSIGHYFLGMPIASLLAHIAESLSFGTQSTQPAMILGVITANFIVALVAGYYINIKAPQLVLYHGLVVAILVICIKFIGPSFNMFSITHPIISIVTTFVSIILATYICKVAKNA